MGDNSAQDTNSSLGDIYAAYGKYLPGILYNTYNAIEPSELATVKSEEAVAPRRQALGASLYNTYSPYYSGQQAGDYATYNPIYAGAGQATERDLLLGSGGETVLAGEGLNRLISPEYYTGIQETGNKLSDLLASNDLSGALSSGEMVDIERNLARTQTNRGINDLQLPANTLRAAQTFGGAYESKLNQKKQNVVNAINSASQFLPTSKSQTNVFDVGTGKTGSNTFAQWGTGAKDIFNANSLTSSNSQNNVWNTASNLLGSAVSLKNTESNINANKRGVQDTVNEAFGAVGSII